MTGTLKHSEIITDISGNPIPIQSTRPLAFNEQDFQPTRGSQLQITETGEYRYDHRKLFYRGDEKIEVGDQIMILGTTYTVAAVLPYMAHVEVVLNANK
ncbi:MAG TPA: hypothetical protein PLP59_09920 [Thermotogota bacterium]|nr:hypothetical protein [Thermotogota bacterium]HQN22509.1 hypothetical protein [Thermotogota bacterium]HQQ66344.1 hypothetical protein [Thermotogota bacterium]